MSDNEMWVEFKELQGELGNLQTHLQSAKETLRETERERDALRAVCRTIMDAIDGHTEWSPDPEVDHELWNPDYHINITLTVADCRALKEVLK